MTKEEGKKDLEKLTRTKLIEEAKKYPDIVGASGMSKEDLVEAIKAELHKLGEEMPETPAKTGKAAKKAKKKTADKAQLKEAMKKLKAEKAEALEAKDSVRLKRARQRYRKLNRALRRAAAAV